VIIFVTSKCLADTNAIVYAIMVLADVDSKLKSFADVEDQRLKQLVEEKLSV
jgi:hypothetical protein